LALAYRLYQDATRASELVALNDAPHPLFMPTSGKALAV
jgi:prophage DNA circulation protein